jgi:hypothetical protein
MTMTIGAWLLFILLPPRHGRVGGPCTPMDSLTVRNGHGMVADSVGGRVVLFGGADNRRVLNDLWAWDGQGWQCLAVGGPSPRTFPAMAYDAARREIILFGGNRVLFGDDTMPAATLGDMWVRDSAGWRQRAGRLPPRRAEASMAYDPVRRRVVLFGGYDLHDGRLVRLGDTWEWDGQVWRQVAAVGPTPRHGAAMAYHAGMQRVVMFGGNGASGETWTWDGRHWTLVAGDVPGRYNASMAESDDGQLLRFGGWDGTTRTDDTWQLVGPRWRAMSTPGPSARNHATLIHDPVRRVTVLFGGHDGDSVFGDLWEWDGTRWTRRLATPPRRREDNGH